MTLVLYMVAKSSSTSFCIINQSCQSKVYAEIWNRRLQSIFTDGFKQTVENTPNSERCCDTSNSGCNYPGTDPGDGTEILLWVDCGMNRGGQSVVACTNCNVIVNENNMIIVQDQNYPNPKSIYACN